MRYALQVAALMSLVAIRASAIHAQAGPPGRARPKELMIIIETEKLGHSSAHAKLEADWSAANSRAGYTDAYLGLVANTGAPELWWISAHPSNDARQKAAEAQPARVNAVAERFLPLDAAHIDNVRVLYLTYRPDLSVGEPADLAMARGMEITRWRIRPGHDVAFAAAAKTYYGIERRVGVSSSTATYEVTAGAPGGTYISLTARKSGADYDTAGADYERTVNSFTAEEGTSLGKFLADGVISIESNRFRFAPDMSLLPAEWVARDPGFWTPSWKRVAVKP